MSNIICLAAAIETDIFLGGSITLLTFQNTKLESLKSSCMPCFPKLQLRPLLSDGTTSGDYLSTKGHWISPERLTEWVAHCSPLKQGPGQPDWKSKSLSPPLQTTHLHTSTRVTTETPITESSNHCNISTHFHGILHCVYRLDLSMKKKVIRIEWLHRCHTINLVSEEIMFRGTVCIPQ